MAFPQEFLGLIRGATLIAKAGFELQEKALTRILRSYNVQSLLKNVPFTAKHEYVNENNSNFLENINEVGENLQTVINGLNEFISHSLSTTFKDAGRIKSDADRESTQQLQKKIDQEITLTSSDKDLLKKLDLEISKNAGSNQQGSKNNKDLGKPESPETNKK